VVHKDKKKEHLSKWRDRNRLQYFIEIDDAENLGLMYKHGCKPEAVIDSISKNTALHLIAKFGAVHCLVLLMGLGIENLDPVNSD